MGEMPLCICVFNTSPGDPKRKEGWRFRAQTTSCLTKFHKFSLTNVKAKMPTIILAGSYTTSMNVMLPINQIQHSKKKEN